MNSGIVKAEVEVDGQHGPIVRVQVGEITVGVYLLSETAVLTAPEGQAGIEVAGPWHKMREAFACWHEWTKQPDAGKGEG